MKLDTIVCLSVCLSVYLSTCLHVLCEYVSLSVFCVSVCLSVNVVVFIWYYTKTIQEVNNPITLYWCVSLGSALTVVVMAHQVLLIVSGSCDCMLS